MRFLKKNKYIKIKKGQHYNAEIKNVQTQLPALKAKYKRMFLILTIQTQMAEVGFFKSVYPLSIMI